MFDHMGGMMRILAKKKTEQKEDFFFVGKCARQKLSKQSTEVIPMTSKFLISAHINQPFRMMRSFRRGTRDW
jgi:hypothetical protein